MKKLAMDGGEAVRTQALAPWPFFAADEVQSVVDVLQSGKVNYWTGNLVKKFENDFASYHGLKHGIALANGTLALELALFGFDIGPGDEVITTSRTFIASASCIARVGATPVVCEVDPESQNMTASTIEPLITAKTKALIVVHLAGWPCDMPAIMKLAKKHNLKVIEDCAQAHGAKLNSQLAGSFGDMAAFSFCQDKIMTTGGEGGMLILNDTEIYEKMWAFKDHGKSFEAVYRREHPPGFRWLHESFGTNWRLTEMQAALGLLQLGKLAAWVGQRRKLAHKIIQGLEAVSALRPPLVPSTVEHSFYKLYFFVDPTQLQAGWSRDRIMAALNAEGIPCFVGSNEIYSEKAFTRAHLGPGKPFPVAQKLSETSLVFLVHPTLDEAYANAVITAVRKVFEVAAK